MCCTFAMQHMWFIRWWQFPALGQYRDCSSYEIDIQSSLDTNFKSFLN